ncbi:subtilisin-like protein [Westerdykella ornata]|uniref:Subtilisin-like protein n=1 Tax=Westerdykella ornata TaxID=318751 RepID=A0A6A6JW00_WESOR|nr:subtilisin-like protein [Westerdykella ornata]KAF2279229.1 subtilisin-like protein [Westerdykella ornata]
MRWENLGLFFGAALCGTTAAIANFTTELNIIPGAYIVELHDDHHPNSFMRTIKPQGIALRQTLNYKLFKGVSIQLDNKTADLETAISQIASQDNVKQVWPVRRIPLPNDTVIWKAGDGPLSRNAWRKRQLSNTSESYAPHHKSTQVDRLHAKGVTGKGTKIAVIDTGIDWRHPALGGCFGEGCLVSYGKNFSGSDTEPLDCIGHGTHVAGIIAAQKNELGVLGAAPGVTLGSYRVFGCVGGGEEDVLLAAFNQAFEDGSDIITASVGAPGGFPESPMAVALQRIVEAGVPCTVSAGNGGGGGLFNAETPADGKGVASIASTENTEIPDLLLEGHYAVDNSSKTTFYWKQGYFFNEHTWSNISLPLWATPYNNSGTECEMLPSDTPDLSDRIVLIRAASACYDIGVGQLLEDAVSYGARHMLLYVDIPGPVYSYITDKDIDSYGFIPYNQGLEWAEDLAKGRRILVDLPNPATANQFLKSDPNPKAGYISEFSTWGPGNRMESTTHFAAPGSFIFSTYPLDQGGYAVLSGTSMATPLAAAIYALVGQVRGTLDPNTIKSVIASTSKPNVFWAGGQAYPYLAPTAQQGAGLIQAYDAAYTTTVLTVPEISFNDTDHLVANVTFTIRNIGDREKTYSLSNVRAATAYFRDENMLPHAFPPAMDTKGAELSFNSEKITVPAGGEAVVVVTPTPPDLNSKRIPVYSGFICLNASDNESLSLPYLGTSGSLYNLDPLDKTPGRMIGVLEGRWSKPIQGNETFTFPIPKGPNDPITYTYPVVGIVSLIGTPEFRCHAISLDPALNQQEHAGFKVVGMLKHFPIRLLPRAVVLANIINGLLEDDSYMPAGGYKILFSALRNYGDASKPEDWDTVVSLPFFINYTDEAAKSIG